uniref:MBL fold metallo-hydrolase n=1 Tax=Candidatus Enterococcus willemsii TaxID=1857215 RepID=UPI00403F014F
MKKIHIEILGGCGEYGRNCFYVEENQQAILLDCGIMNDRSQQLPDLQLRHVKKLQAVFISHLHKDHVGALEYLAKLGYKGPVILSDLTYQWLPENDLFTFCPFVTSEQKWQTVADNLQFLWGYSGHVIGSVWYSLIFNQQTIFFSGDISLTSTLYPVHMPPSLAYELAFIDSGNAGMQISNLVSKEQMRRIITANPNNMYRITSKFTAKCLEILLYLFETTTAKLFIDEDIERWLIFHQKHSKNLLYRTQQTMNALFESKRLCKRNQLEAGIYFLTSKSDILSTDIVGTLDNIPFKNHLDTNEIYYLQNYVGAKETIYFHSEQCTPQTTWLEILANSH